MYFSFVYGLICGIFVCLRYINELVAIRTEAQMKIEMFRNYYKEERKAIEIKDYAPQKSRVFISNYERVKKKSSGREGFRLTKLIGVNGFSSISYPRNDNSRQGKFYIHKMVATCFLELSEKGEDYVTHLDHNLLNNQVSNLKYKK